MSKEYRYPVVIRDGKAFMRRSHVSRDFKASIPIINRTVEDNNIETLQVDFQVYIDVDATLEALKKRRFQPARAATEVDLGSGRQRRMEHDLFAPKVA